MYLAHWGLREAPFSPRLDPRTFHASPVHNEALARLLFLVEERRRVGLLLGESGTGKSLLLATLASELRATTPNVVAVNLLGAEPQGFLWGVAAALGANPDVHASTHELWRAVTDQIAAARYQQLPTVLMLDDADRASRECQATVLRLVHADLAPEARLTVVLASRLNTSHQLDRRLLELAELRVDLAPWEEVDTAAFVRESLARAGGTEPIFEAGALTRLHQLAQGIPRHVCQLAELALVAGAGEHLRRLDAGTIEAVYQELGVVETLAE
ncbi:MAG: AAA family ATPase [Pirellulales bacterium]|nr:AAA family ATPase [Pirellulales bacterium]